MVKEEGLEGPQLTDSPTWRSHCFDGAPLPKTRRAPSSITLLPSPRTAPHRHHHRHNTQGAWFDSAEGADAHLAMRLKEDYDGAEPAPTSVAVANCVRLAALAPGWAPPAAAVQGGAAAAQAPAGDAPAAGGKNAEAEAEGAGAAYFLARADAALAAMAGRVSGRAAAAAPQLAASAWLRARAPLRQAVVAGARGDPAADALLAAAAAGAGWPRDVAVVAIDPGCPDDTSFWRAANPRALAMVEAEARRQQQAAGGSGGAAAFEATAFVCQDYTCKAPARDAATLLRQLREPLAAAAAGGGGGSGEAAAARLAEFKWPGPPPVDG